MLSLTPLALLEYVGVHVPCAQGQDRLWDVVDFVRMNPVKVGVDGSLCLVSVLLRLRTRIAGTDACAEITGVNASQVRHMQILVFELDQSPRLFDTNVSGEPSTS
jgi:hypothetical protein